MYKFVKKGAFMLLVASLAMGVASCDDDDPDYENVIPPVIEIAPSQITGVVTAMNGNAIKGATIKATTGGKDVTATTNANGSYILENVTAGTYIIEVAAEGKQIATGNLTVSKEGETVIYNAMLANVGKEVIVSATEEVVEETKTEVPEDNKEAEVTTIATIPASALEDTEAKIILTTVYTEEAVSKDHAMSKANTRASKSTMLMGTDVSCSKEGVELKKPISLEFELGVEVVAVITVKKNVNGIWEKVDARKEGNKVTVDVGEFGTYSVFADVDVVFSTSTEAISFSQSEFDNLYGSKDIQVNDVTYAYKQGGEIGKSTGKINAQLRQILAHQIQGNKVTTATSTYPLNVTLPIGTALTLTGSQALTTVTASCDGKSANGKVYGNVNVEVTTYNRQHTGGGSQPGV